MSTGYLMIPISVISKLLEIPRSYFLLPPFSFFLEEGPVKNRMRLSYLLVISDISPSQLVEIFSHELNIRDKREQKYLENLIILDAKEKLPEIEEKIQELYKEGFIDKEKLLLLQKRVKRIRELKLSVRERVEKIPARAR